MPGASIKEAPAFARRLRSDRAAMIAEWTRSAGLMISVSIIMAACAGPETIRGQCSFDDPPFGKDRRGNATSGTAVAVTRQGHWLTAAHVVRHCSDIVILTGNSMMLRAVFVAAEAEKDLAILQTDPVESVVPLQRDTWPAQGEKHFAIGFPSRHLRSVDLLFFRRFRCIEPSRPAQGAAQVIRGDMQGWVAPSQAPPFNRSEARGLSGGPILSAQGRLVGMAVGVKEPFPDPTKRSSMCNLHARIGIDRANGMPGGALCSGLQVFAAGHEMIGEMLEANGIGTEDPAASPSFDSIAAGTDLAAHLRSKGVVGEAICVTGEMDGQWKAPALGSEKFRRNKQ